MHKLWLFSVLNSVLSVLVLSDESTTLFPTNLMKHETKWLVKALEQAHYNKVSIESLDAATFLDRYLEKLDKQKLYFKKAEVEAIKSKFSPTLIALFQQGNLFPGFEIYNQYKSLSLQRMDWALDYLDDIPDLHSKQKYYSDRTEMDWEKTDSHLEETWKKLITSEFLNETLSQLDLNSSSPIEEDGYPDLLEESREILVKRYKRWKKNIMEFESGDVQELYLTTFTQMFDPHTTFMNIKEKEKFDQAMNNEFVGIGAVLSDVDGYCTIKELLPGGPAEASRELEPEDIILKVAQSEGSFVDVVDMKLSKIVDLIKGPKDTLVRLEIRPGSNPKTSKVVGIVRDKIKLTANLASGKVFEVRHNESVRMLGVVELPSFYGSTGDGHKATDDVEEIIEKFKKNEVEGIVLDLRRNGGGYLSEAVNLAGLFISRGPVVQVKSTDGNIRKKFDFDPKLSWNGPLAILVSRFSASASEIVAGALQNHKRAIIIGDPSTHGKGTVQSLIQMNLPFNFFSDHNKKSAAKITIQKYYLPSGKSTQISGVDSDISMPTINVFRPIGESDLEYALECDSIPPVKFRRPPQEFSYKDSTLLQLSKNSMERQSSLEEFSYLNESVNWFQEKQQEKSETLNLEERIKLKHLNNDKNDLLNEKFDNLSTKSFKEKDVILEIVKEQNAKSILARGDEELETDHTTSEFKKSESLDIRLHESLRIVSDWIFIRNENELSQSANPMDKEI